MNATPPRTPRSASGRTQLTPQDWINAAMSLLVDKSIDAVRVDVLAKRMSVTRGSFYWHFTDRDQLLQEVLTHWRNQATEQVIARFERSGATPEFLIRDLIGLPFHGQMAVDSASVELAIRAWARRDDVARRVVDEVDAHRLSYIAQCLSALGHSFQDSANKAFLLYTYMIGESLLRNQGAPSQREQRRKFIEGLVLPSGKASATPTAIDSQIVCAAR